MPIYSTHDRTFVSSGDTVDGSIPVSSSGTFDIEGKTGEAIQSLVTQLKLLNARFEEAFETKFFEKDLTDED